MKAVLLIAGIGATFLGASLRGPSAKTDTPAIRKAKPTQATCLVCPDKPGKTTAQHVRVCPEGCPPCPLCP